MSEAKEISRLRADLKRKLADGMYDPLAECLITGDIIPFLILSMGALSLFFDNQFDPAAVHRFCHHALRSGQGVPGLVSASRWADACSA